MAPSKKRVPSAEIAEHLPEISHEEILAIGAFLLLAQHESGHGGSINWALRRKEERRVVVRQRDPRKTTRTIFPSPQGGQ
jgi:hypothetical protein